MEAEGTGDGEKTREERGDPPQTRGFQRANHPFGEPASRRLYSDSGRPLTPPSPPAGRKRRCCVEWLDVGRLVVPGRRPPRPARAGASAPEDVLASRADLPPRRWGRGARPLRGDPDRQPR